MDNLKEDITIGDLVKRLKNLYPDISESKLRFLELKGLLSPKRSDKRYRLYNKEDIVKINFILKMQKDFFMPLEVIKGKLKNIDFDKIDVDKDIVSQLKLEINENRKILSDSKISLEEIKQKYKIDKSFVMEMAENELISLEEEGFTYKLKYSDVEILRTAFALSKYGIHVKHLKLFENFANRQSSFIQQIVLPLFLSTNQESHRKATQHILKLEELICDLNSFLVKRENKFFIDKYK
jgi:DNA-binding transcriptional MerR regulator